MHDLTITNDQNAFSAFLRNFEECLRNDKAHTELYARFSSVLFGLLDVAEKSDDAVRLANMLLPYADASDCFSREYRAELFARARLYSESMNETMKTFPHDDYECLTVCINKCYDYFSRDFERDTPGLRDKLSRDIEAFVNGKRCIDTPYKENQVLNSRELLGRQISLRSKPSRLGISLTTACNLGCVMCGVKYMNWELPQAAVREITALMPYLFYIQWLGGEAFLSPHFEKLFSEACRYPHLRQSINTNGLLIDEEWASRLVSNNVTIDLSIDGISKDTYEKIRTGADHAVLLSNLARIMELRSARKSSTEVTMNYVVMDTNAGDIGKIVEFAAAYGFDRVLLSREYGIAGPIGISDDTMTYLGKALPAIRHEAVERGVTLIDRSGVPDIEENLGRSDGLSRKCPGQYPACFVPWKSLFIKTGGEVYPDCICPKSLGNIAEHSLAELWNNDVMQDYRRSFVQDGISDSCSRCALYGARTLKYLG